MFGQISPQTGASYTIGGSKYGQIHLARVGGVPPSQYIWGCPKTDSHWTNRQIERQMTQQLIQIRVSQYIYAQNGLFGCRSGDSTSYMMRVLMDLLTTIMCWNE